MYDSSGGTMTLAQGVVDYYMGMILGLESIPQLCAPAKQLPILSTCSSHDFFQQDGSSESSSPHDLVGG